VIFEHQDRETAHEFWRKSQEASSIGECTSHGDDINLLDLLAKVEKGEKFEEDQQEDEEYFRVSTILQGSLSD
jgi:hypothetical protein